MNTDFFPNFPYEDFYVLSDKDIRGCLWLSPFPDPQIKYPDTITDVTIVSGTYTIRKGKIWTDTIYCSWPGLLVVSEKMRDLLDLLVDATGISFYPVNILDKELKAIDVNYYGFHATGRCGIFIKSLSRSALAKRIPTGPEFVRKVGLYFDPTTWDGSDFFVPEGTAFIFVSKRVHDIIETSGLTNVYMRSIVEIEAR